MAAVTLPDSTDTVDMKDWLYNKRSIEVVVHRWLGKPILRCSAHAHTSRADIDALAMAVNEYLRNTI